MVARRSHPSWPGMAAAALGARSRPLARSQVLLGASMSARPPIRSSFPIRSSNRWSGPISTAGPTDDHVAAFTAFLTSCRPFLQGSPPARSPAGRSGAVGGLPPHRQAQAGHRRGGARVLRGEFPPGADRQARRADGLLTGYYEPVVDGSRFPNPEFPVPIYRRPPDLEAHGYKRGSTSFPNRKSVPVGRRNDKNELVPYPDRGQIEDGALDGQKLEICWMRDWFEAMTIQIQGSARVLLEDGTMLRINYDSPQRPSLFGGRPRADRAQRDSARRDVDGAHPRLDEGQSEQGGRGARRPTARSCSSASPASTRTTSRSARRACR